MHARHTKWLLILPAIASLVFLGIFPFAYSFYLSLHRWPKIPVMPLEFIGLGNYVDALDDPNFIHSILLTLKFIGISIPLQFGTGLAVALALNRLGKTGKALCPVLLVGSMVCAVSVGIMWYLMFSYHYGPISHVLDLLGLQRIDWLGTDGGALASIVIADSWYASPFVMIVLYAGLIGLPPDVFEAARIDGASAWHTFCRVTLPLLKPVIVVIIAIRLTDAIKMFGLVRAMTEGGPGNATEVVTYYIFNQGFTYWNLSYAAALTFFLLGLVLAIFIIYLRIAKGSEV